MNRTKDAAKVYGFLIPRKGKLFADYFYGKHYK